MAARRFEERAAPETQGKFNWHRFFISALLTNIPFTICFILVAAIPGFWAGITIGVTIRLFLFFVGMVNCAQILWMSWHVPAGNETWLLNRRHAAPFYLTLLLAIFLAYVVWFAVGIFPLIPFSLGGGRPLTVAFIQGEKKLPEEILLEAGSKRSVPYKLLVATDKNYVVLSQAPNEKSMEVSRDSVAGIIVLADSGP